MSNMEEKFKQIISDSSIRTNTRDFESITFRPNPKIAAMMEAYLHTAEDPASTAFTNFISEQLAAVCMDSSSMAETVIDSFKEHYSNGNIPLSPDSALGILIEKEVVKISHTDDLYKDLILFKDS